MPELPEVETTRRGIEPWLCGQPIQQVQVRQPKLRWPVAQELHLLQGQVVERLARRGKYLLLYSTAGVVLVHLGMSGSLRVVDASLPPRKHDHVDLVLANGKAVRFHDPRRFGAWLWADGQPELHPLLRDLGVEPLSDAFNADFLFAATRKRTCSIKAVLMDAHTVVGVGNIYANEALFRARLNPQRPAGNVTYVECAAVVEAVRQILTYAIERGGTTLRDFVREDGTAGYFQLELMVYGRTNQPCVRCGGTIHRLVQGQRSTWFCPACQA